MTDYDNTNRGAFWKNDRREKDTHPHFKGSINIEGKEYWLSGWKKADDAKENAPLVSLSVQPKEARQEQSAPAPVADDPFDDGDILPF